MLYQFTSTAINCVNGPRCVGDRRIQKEQFSGYERKRVGKLPKKGLVQVSTGGSALHHWGRKLLHVTARWDVWKNNKMLQLWDTSGYTWMSHVTPKLAHVRSDICNGSNATELLQQKLRVLLHRVLWSSRLQRGPFTPVWHWRMALQWVQTTSHSSLCPPHWQRAAKGPCSKNETSVQPIVLRNHID